jgi:hypothetical protein
LRSGALVAFAVTLAVGVGFVLSRATSHSVPVAFTVGPGPTPVAGELPPRAQACEQPIELLADADGVTFWVGTGARPGVPLEVTVRDLRKVGGRPLALRRVAGGYASHSPLSVRFPRLRKGRVVALCISNQGHHPATLSGGDTAPTSGTTFAGRSQPVDLTLVFFREHPPSTLGSVPTMFRRATLFRPGWVGTWTFWLLAALVAIGVPLLCALALARAARDPR